MVDTADLRELGLEIQVLGAVFVAHGSELRSVGGIRERTLLSLLVIRAGSRVTIDELAEEIWGTEAPASTLRSYASRLRRVLDTPDHRSVLVADNAAYRLLRGTYTTDAMEFESRVEAARGTDPEQRSHELAEALLAWRGPPFADAAQTPVIAAEASRLDELRLATLEDRLDADLAIGRHRRIISELRDLTDQNPLRERMWRLLILSLYRSGRQSESLRAMQRLRKALREQLGINPSRRVSELEHLILVQDRRLDWQPPAERRQPAPVAVPLPATPMPALRTGQLLLSASAFSQAVKHFTSSLAAIGEPSNDDERELACDLLLGLAQARLFSRDTAGTRDAALLAADHARNLGSAPRLAMAAVWASYLNTVGAADPAVMTLCEDALEMLGEQETALRARVLAGRADYEVYGEGDGEAAVETASEALAAAQQSEDPVAISRCLFVHSEALSWTPRAAERLLVAERLMAHAERWGDVAAECDGRHGRALARLTLGDVAGFDRDRAQLEMAALEHPYWYPRVFLPLWRAMRAMMKGQFESVESTISELLALASHEPNIQHLAAAQLLFLKREQGRLSEIAPLVDQLADQPNAMPVIQAARAWMLAEMGRTAEAGCRLQELVNADGVAVPHDITWTMSLCLLAETAAKVRDEQAATTLLRLLGPYRGQLAVLAKGVATPASIDRYIGLLRIVVGDGSTAASFESALRLEERLLAPAVTARTKVCFGEWLCRQSWDNDNRHGAILLSEGLHTAVELGMEALVTEAEACIEAIAADHFRHL